MFERISKIILVVLFISMITIPLLTINLQKGKISDAENRMLAYPPELYNEDGTRNENFTTDFETWINDNLGFRSTLVTQNAKIQYNVFNVLANGSDTVLGPKGEVNYATQDIIRSYQHFDLKSEDELKLICDGFQCANDYLAKKGIQLYYFQCWDKQSIYPEHFPRTVIQYGEQSRTDQIVDALKKRTNVRVISPKEALINGKQDYDTYSKWGDATHWTQRGAYIGYNLLMSEINKNNAGKYRVLEEKDYEITITDQGSTLFGGIHKEEYLENFVIREPKAYQTEEAPVWLSQWANCSRLVYFNDSVNNSDTLLILGDSYFDNFLYDDFAESFSKVVLVWGDYARDFSKMIEYYNPTIVVVENAERCDRTGNFAAAALELLNEE